MLTLITISEEIKAIPVHRLEALYQFGHSLIPPAKPTGSARGKILSFGGAFSDMSSKDYADFLIQTKKMRTKLLDRHIEL